MFSTAHMLCCVFVLLLCFNFTQADNEGGSENPLNIEFLISEGMICENVNKNQVKVQEGSNFLLVAKSKIGTITGPACHVNGYSIQFGQTTISTKDKRIVTTHMEKRLAGEWKCELRVQDKPVYCSVTVEMLEREKEDPRDAATNDNKKEPEVKILFDAKDDPCKLDKVTLTNGEEFVLEVRGHHYSNARCTKGDLNKTLILSNDTFNLQPNNTVTRVVIEAEMKMSGTWSCFFNEWSGRNVRCYATIFVTEKENDSSKDKTNEHNDLNKTQQKKNGSSKVNETSEPIPVWGIIAIAVVGCALLIAQSLVILHLVIKRRKARAPNSLQAISAGGDCVLNRNTPRYSLLPWQRKRIERPAEMHEYETVEYPPVMPTDEDQPTYEDGDALIQDPRQCFNPLPQSWSSSPDKTPAMSRPLPLPPRHLDHLGLETRAAFRENHRRRCRVRSGSVDQLELLRNEIGTCGNAMVSELQGKFFTKKPAPLVPPKPKSFKSVKSPDESTKWPPTVKSPPSINTRLPLPEEAFKSLPRRVLPVNPSLPHKQLLPKDNIRDSESGKPINSPPITRKMFTPSSPRMPIKSPAKISQSTANKTQSPESHPMPATFTKLLPVNTSTKIAPPTLPKLKPKVPEKSVTTQLSPKNQAPIAANAFASIVEELREKKKIKEIKSRVPPPSSTQIGLDSTRSGPSQPIMNQSGTSTNPTLTQDNSDYESIGNSDDEYWEYAELPKNLYSNVNFASS